MASDEYLEVVRQLRVSQDKCTYFVLVATASAVAFALARAENAPLTWQLVPWGVALLAWGISFFLGCQHLRYTCSTLYANAELFRVKRGQHPEAGSHPDVIAAASAGILSAMESNSKKAAQLASRQFHFFIGGTLAYVAWQILRMAAR